MSYLFEKKIHSVGRIIDTFQMENAAHVTLKGNWFWVLFPPSLVLSLSRCFILTQAQSANK